MADTTTVGFKITTDASDATKDIDKLDQSLTDTEGAVKSLRAQLKEAIANVATMSDKFGATSIEAITAAKKAGELKDKIADARVMTDAFNPDAKFKAVAASLGGVAGGFSAVQGAMALFGKENKDVEAALLKVNAAMALSQGLNAVGDSIDSFKTLSAQIQMSTTFQKLNNLATAAAAVVTKAFGAAVQTTSLGFQALKGAIAATGIGVLAIVLGTLINKIMDWVGSTEDAETAQKKLNDTLKDYSDLLKDELAMIDFDTKARIARAKIAGSSEKDLTKITLDGHKERLDAYKENYDRLLALEDAQRKDSKLTADQRKDLADKTTAAQKLWLDEQSKDQLSALEAQADQATKARAKALEEKKKHDDKVVADTATANKLLIDLQAEKALAEITSEDEKAKSKLKIDSDAKLAEIEKLTVNEDLKKKLRDAANDAYEADLTELTKKQVEAKTKKDEEESKAQTEFQAKIADIKIAAIKDDDDREEATRLAKLKKQLADLDADKEFIKLSETDKAAVKKDLITASEEEGYKAKNEKTKKGLEDEVDLLQAQQKGLTQDSKAYWDNLQAVEDKSYEAKILGAKGNAKEIEKINAEHAANNKAIDDAEKENKKKNLLDKFGMVEQFGKDIQALAGKNKELAIAGVIIEKAAAIGSVVVNTVAATAKSIAASPLTLGLPWSALIIAGGIAQVAMIVKSGIDQINEINKATPNLPAGGAGAGGSAPSLGGAVGGGGALPSTGGGGGSPDLSGGGGTGGGGGSAGGGGAMQVYVLESDISGSQKRVQTIENRANFE
jgi:hypothetical protein